MFKFPKDDLDVPSKTTSLVGGYWNEVYEGKDEVSDLVSSRNTLWQQVRDYWEEVYRTKSRQLIDPLSTKSWQHFPILKSEGTSTKDNYGGSRRYGDSAFSYGKSVGYAWDLPQGVVSVSQIYNRVTDPSLSLIEGVDFVIDRKLNKIVFNADPFLNDSLPKLTVNSKDGTSDVQLSLWMFRPKIDRRSIQDIYGIPVGVDGESNNAYKAFINNVYDSIITGMSSGRLGYILGNSLGLPVSIGSEIVQRVHGSVRKVIITDKNVYFVPLTASATVSVDDKVIEGQSLTDALVIKELIRNSDISSINALNLTKGFISNDFMYDLGFVNKNVNLQVYESEGQKTEVRFYVGGHPLDTDMFWEIVNSNSVIYGKTLAEGLDKRVEKVGQPSKVDLPSQINPLRFLVDEMIPGGFTLVTIRVESITPNLPRLSLIPDLVTLGNGVFFIFEAPLAIDSSFNVQSSSEDQYIAAETFEGFDAVYFLNSVTSIKSISSSCA
jgi:hypothetical protein